jgi:hypothetical protein
MKAADMTGQRVGRWTVLAHAGNNRHRKAMLCGSAGAIAGLRASSTEETFATVTPKAAAWQTG